MRCGIRIPACYLLMVAVLGILSGCESLRDFERFANRYHTALTTALGAELTRSPSVRRSGTSSCRWTSRPSARPFVIGPSLRSPDGAEGLDQLICDGKALRGSVVPTAGGGSTFIVQVTLYSAALGLAISQACYAMGENHERALLKMLLGELDLEGLQIQADACIP